MLCVSEKTVKGNGAATNNKGSNNKSGTNTTSTKSNNTSSSASKKGINKSNEGSKDNKKDINEKEEKKTKEIIIKQDINYTELEELVMEFITNPSFKRAKDIFYFICISPRISMNISMEFLYYAIMISYEAESFVNNLEEKRNSMYYLIQNENDKKELLDEYKKANEELYKLTNIKSIILPFFKDYIINLDKQKNNNDEVCNFILNIFYSLFLK